MAWETGKTYRISYEPEGGIRTERVIDLIRAFIAADGRIYLKAFCHLRGEERTFRADRVMQCTCLSVPETTRSAASPDTESPITPVQGSSDSRAIPRPEPANANSASATSDSWWPDRSGPRQTYQEKPRLTFTDFLVNVLSYGIVGVFVLFILGSFFSSDLDTAGATGTPASSYAYTPAPPPVRPPSLPKPSLEETVIGGRLLRTRRNGASVSYEVPSLGIVTADKASAILGIRLAAFVAATGLVDQKLVTRYLTADLDTSGKLSLEELSVFQRATYADFKYELNERALRPDEFLASRAGDCDDFALYTAGLLRFWGWDPYLASFGPSGNGIGHAVCLYYEAGAIPAGYTYFNVESWTAMDGTVLKPGRYVPVDYDHVGALSDAVEKGWKLRSIHIPEKSWGLSM